MTLRDKALGRAKGPWVANTLFIRGDVVKYLGALYAAKETFSSGATFDANNWDILLDAPTIPTATTIGAMRATIGPGLPSFLGRNQGDIHFNTTNNKGYILSGIAGTTASDNFDRAAVAVNQADGAYGGVTISGTTYPWIGDSRYYYLSGTCFYQFGNNGAGGSTARQPIAHLTAGSTTQPVLVAANVSESSNNGGGVLARASARPSGNNDAGGYTATINGNANPVLTLSKGGVALGSAPAINGYNMTTANPLKVTLLVSGTTILATAEDQNGVTLASVPYTDATPAAGAYHGISLSWYGQVEDYTIQLGGTQAWQTLVPDVAVVAAPTLASLGGTRTTVGTGLPTFTGRVAGDQHFDDSIGIGYILTGVAGSTFTEAFGRGATNPLNDLAGNTLTLSNMTSQIDASARWGLSMTQTSGYAEFTGSNGAQDLAADVVTKQYGAILYVLSTGGYASGYMAQIDATGQNHFLRLYRNNAQVGAAIDLGNQAFDNQIARNLRITTTPSGTSLIVKAFVQDTERISYTDTTPLTGTKVGFAGNSAYGGTITFDNVSYTAAGSLSWNTSQPVFAQAQLVSGAAVVANHVLKPGIRVPIDGTLRQVVLRADTAPVGASLTVTVERFNNGASQGVIATAAIATGTTVGSVTGLVAGCAKGDILKFNVTTIGSTTAGSDITASLDFF